MQTIEVLSETVVEVTTPTTSVLQPPAPLETQKHRIYVWSSPSPYSLVIEESRSFHRHI